MPPEVLYYVWATLLVIACVISWCLNFFALPGNWIVVALMILFAVFVDGPEGTREIGSYSIAIVFGLAVAGELLELVASAAGAAKQGGSRRATVLAIVGAIVGSIAGAAVGVPVPLAGPAIGAIGGGALGAFVGAYAGEAWKGKGTAEALNVSKAALIGRLLGTTGKLAVGAIMLVVVGLAAFL